MKVGIIGAGNVGAMVASRIVDNNLADVIMIDILPGLAKGKAIDISDTRPITNSISNIVGSEDVSEIKDCNIVVVTAGLSRRPDMSRSDLLEKNSLIIKDISLAIRRYAPSSIVIMVTNPLDVMTYLAMKITGFEPKRVIGMAGILDTARFINILSERFKRYIDRDSFFILGGHDDTMLPIKRPISIPDGIFKEVSIATKNRGTEITGYLKTGSAYFAPSAAVFSMLKAIIKDENKLMCVSAYLDGQYGENDVYAGVPCTLNSSGVSRIVEIDISPEEKKLFKESVQKIKENIARLKI